MANATVQSSIAELALSQEMSGEAECKSPLLNGMLTAFATVLSGYFILAAGSLYWLVAGAGALGAKVFPRSLMRRHQFLWLLASTSSYRSSHSVASGLFSGLLQSSRGSSRDQLLAISGPRGASLSPLHRVR